MLAITIGIYESIAYSTYVSMPRNYPTDSIEFLMLENFYISKFKP